jgi:hypothetical protein
MAAMVLFSAAECSSPLQVVTATKSDLWWLVQLRNFYLMNSKFAESLRGILITLNASDELIQQANSFDLEVYVFASQTPELW